MHPPWWELCVVSVIMGFNILMFNMQKTREYKEEEETDEIMKSDTPPIYKFVSPRRWWNIGSIFHIDYYKTDVLKERENPIYVDDKKRVVNRTLEKHEFFIRTVRVKIPLSPLDYERNTVRRLGAPKIIQSYFYIYPR